MFLEAGEIVINKSFFRGGLCWASGGVNAVNICVGISLRGPELLMEHMVGPIASYLRGLRPLQCAHVLPQGGTPAATFVGLPIVGKHTEVDYRLDERLLQCSEEYSHDGLQKIRHKQEAGREVTEANLGLGVDEGLLVDAADALQVADVLLGCCWRRRPAASSRANTRALPRPGRSTQAGDGDFILIWRH